MRKLLSKIENRKLNLVELLQHKTGFTSLAELSKHTGTSVRILKEDFQELQQLDHILSVTLLPNDVALNFYEHTGFEAIGKHFLQQNFAFTMLENIFYNENFHHEELAEHLFISTSTLYRHFRKIETVLRESYDVSLATNPCRIVGDEDDIRLFYVTFFAEKYSVFEWPFSPLINEADFEKFVKVFVDMVNVEVDFSYLRYIKYVAFVNLMRCKEGYHSDNKISSERYDLITETIKQHDFSYIEKAFGIKMTPDLAAEMFYIFFQETFSYTYEDLARKAEENPEVAESHRLAVDMVQSIAEKFRLRVPNYEELILGVHDTVYLGSTELYTNYLIHDKKDKFISSASKLYPEFMEYLEKLMSEYIWKVHKKEDIILLNHMMYSLMTHWRNLLVSLKLNQPKPCVMVISNNDSKHARMLAGLIEFEFYDELDVHVPNDISPLADGTATEKYDIIVSTFPLRKTRHPRIICIDNLPTEQDMLTIKKHLAELSTAGKEH